MRKCTDGAGDCSGFLVFQQPGVLLQETSPSDRRGVMNYYPRCSLSVFVKSVQ